MFSLVLVVFSFKLVKTDNNDSEMGSAYLRVKFGTVISHCTIKMNM